MSRTEDMELAKWAISQAKKHGADNASVDVSKTRSIEIAYRDSKLDQLKESTQRSLNISIYADNRYSGHSTNDLRKDSLAGFIEEAVAMTKYLSEDPHRTLPDPKYYEGRNNVDLHLYDSAYESVTLNERVEMAEAIEQSAIAQSDKIISCESGYNDSYSETVKVNSNGFEGERMGTSYSLGAEVTIDDGNGGRPSDWDWATVRFRRDIPSLEKLGIVAAERALGKIGQTKLKSGTYDTVIENRALSRLIWSMYSPLTGRSIQQKSSFLDGKLGTRIASEKLTIIDNPFIESGLASRLFDGEGMTTRNRAIIEKGILKSYYIDCYYGSKLGLDPTTGSPTNQEFELGTKSLDELIAGLKKGILITGFIGGNSNSTTGDFSFGIVGAYIEDGKAVKPVNEMNVSGNLIDFWNQLADVGNDPYPYSSMMRPSMYFTDVEFSGI